MVVVTVVVGDNSVGGCGILLEKEEKQMWRYLRCALFICKFLEIERENLPFQR